ncbi:MAG: hypothetical protein EAZ63_03800 [Runella slithyformis]|nr:MAG: hypothetical protein EAZ63_03800 [Runella slithyformis]
MIILNDLNTFVNYFRAWADAQPAVKFFLYGGIEKGMAAARGHDDFGYPIMWLEQPVIYSDDNGFANTNEEFYFGISVLQQYEPGNSASYLAAQSEALSILHDLQKKIRHDNADGRIVATVNGNKKEALSDLWIDKHTGFRLEMKIQFNANSLLC